MKHPSKLFGIVAGPLGFLLVWLFFDPPGLSHPAKAVLASTIWVSVWWITEAIPIAATALLPIVLFPLTGALKLHDTTVSYGHRYIFLYIGGFLLAIAIEKWNLHRRIALHVIRLIGTSVSSIILGFMVATALLSMWVSNTATSVMMLPIGMAIITQLRDNPQTTPAENQVFGKALMLSIAYGASIGGIATLIGTPPNLVLAGVIQELYGFEISFLQWLKFGLPISVFLLVVGWIYLTRVAFHFRQQDIPGGAEEVERHLLALGRVSLEEKIVLTVFGLTASAWISRSFLQDQLGLLPQLDDTIIAMLAGLLLFVLPSRERQIPLLTWEDCQKLPWGIVLLFGGGMALAEGFGTSGLAAWIGTQLTLLQGLSLLATVLVLVSAVNFLTEITSNLATTSMLLPILAPLALSIDVHPFILMVPATVAASCAFMLPVATPPNAVVFGSGYLRIRDMARTGFWMNLISILLITLLVYFALAWLWGFDPRVYPADWR